MRKIVQFVITGIIDGMTEDAADTYQDMIRMGYPMQITIGEDITWAISGSSTIINIMEINEETSK